MAEKRVKINMSQIEPGMTLQFMYGVGKRKRLRTVLVLTHPLDSLSWTRKKDGSRTRVIHTLQLEESRIKQIYGPKLLRILGHFSGVMLAEQEGMKYYKFLIDNMKNSYPQLSPKLAGTDVYRMFDTDILKLNAIYLVDYDYPKPFIKKVLRG